MGNSDSKIKKILDCKSKRVKKKKKNPYLKLATDEEPRNLLVIHLLWLQLVDIGREVQTITIF